MEWEHRRVFLFLAAIRAVWNGDACLTQVGAAYLGVHMRFGDRP